jgi:hypothetical protein
MMLRKTMSLLLQYLSLKAYEVPAVPDPDASDCVTIPRE